LFNLSAFPELIQVKREYQGKPVGIVADFYRPEAFPVANQQQQSMAVELKKCHVNKAKLTVGQ